MSPAWLRSRLDLLCGPVPLVPGMWLFSRSRRDAMLGALEDAATLRLERLDCASSCLECAVSDDGKCLDHEADVAATVAYDDLIVRLQGQAGRGARKVLA